MSATRACTLSFPLENLYNEHDGDDKVDTNYILEQLSNRKPAMMGERNYRKYAILLPLVEQDKEPHLLFEVRSLKMRSQPGDICFPGGRIDESDKTEEQCAIRETTEELGIEPSNIHQVQPLDYIIANDGRIIHPFAGKITTLETLKLNKAEVAEVFTVPLRYFLETEPKLYKVNLEVVPEPNFPFDLIHNGKDYDWRTRQIDELFYLYEDRVIWGLTAKIINHFIELIKRGE